MKPCFVRYGQGLNAFDMNKKVALTGVYSAIDAKSGTLYLLMSLSTGFVLKRSSLRMLMRACATFSRLLLVTVPVVFLPESTHLSSNA
jgi:hypothetical protein